MIAPKSETPILDLISPLPKRRNGRWRRFVRSLLGFALGVVLFPIGILIVYGLIKIIGEQAIAVPTDVLLPLFPIEIFAVITVHELGHVVVGRAVGLRFKRLVIGPVLITSSAQGLKFSLYRDFNFGGFAGMGIRRLGRLRSKLAFEVAAGVIANLISGFAAALAIRYGMAGPVTLVVQSLEVFAVMSMFVAIPNLAPFWLRNGLSSDGKKLLWLLTSKAKTSRWICILALEMQLESGVRPKHLKRTWIARACAVQDRSPMEVAALWIAYVAAQDREQTETAAQRLEECLQRFTVASQQYRALLLTEAAVFQAWNRENEEKAAVWYSKANGNGPGDPLATIRLAISMSWAGRRYDEALSAWQQGLDRIENLPPSPAKNLVEQSWLGWKDEMDKRRAKSATPEDRNSQVCPAQASS